MNQIQYSLGLDVDKASFKACLIVKRDNHVSVKATKTFNNNVSGFSQADDWIKKHKVMKPELLITMEATGVYHEHLAWYFYNLSYRISIVLPLRAKRYMQSLGLKSKTDKIDAQGIAIMGAQQELKEWKPCSKNILILRSLTRQLQMFQENRTVFRNQLEASNHLANCDKMVIKNLTGLIKKIEADIANLKERIEQLVQIDEVLCNKYKLIEPFKGVGIITFATLVAETGGFSLFENQKQLVCYAGYDVKENQSGKRNGKTRISKQGNTHIRRILHLPAFQMVTYRVSPFCQLYERVYERTKIKMKGYVAIQRKLLCMIYTLWKNNTAFDPAYATKTTSGIQDPKLLFSVVPTGTETKIATVNAVATLDELPCTQSPEALFSVS